MRVAAEVGEEALHDGQDEFFVTLYDPAKKLGVILRRPEGVWIFERAAAEHPTFDEVGMHVARLFNREVALIDGAETLGAEAHFLFERERREDALDPPLGLGIKIRIDVMTDEDRESDFVQRVAELRCKFALFGVVAVETSSDVDRPNLELLVELLGIKSLSQLIVLPLFDLVVADEILVGGPDSVFFRLHAWSIIPRNACNTRRRLPRDGIEGRRTSR